MTNKKKEPRSKCILNIPIDEFEHSEPSKHKCERGVHYCGFKCPQCENYCNDNYDQENGHSSSHKMEHGNIINSNFKIIDPSSDVIEVKKEYEYYKMKKEDSAIIFTCSDYCVNQGRGHTHLVSKSIIDNISNKNDKKIKVFEKDNNYYECSCSFFWDNILKMDSGISWEKKKTFEYCDCICPCEKHDPKNNKFNYCKREVFHGKDIPEEDKGVWVSPEGHRFNCDHPSGIFTIFLIDCSGSMRSVSEKTKPGDPDIVNSPKHNNMLGASIEVLLNFCKKRYKINRREKCALIGYAHEASPIIKDIYVAKVDEIKKECLSKLEAYGGTEFKEAFKEAKKLLVEINENKQYIPIIILLTDGEDFNPDEAIKLVKEVN